MRKLVSQEAPLVTGTIFYLNLFLLRFVCRTTTNYTHFLARAPEKTTRSAFPISTSGVCERLSAVRPLFNFDISCRHVGGESGERCNSRTSKFVNAPHGSCVSGSLLSNENWSGLQPA